MSEPLVSIIIPCHNAERYVGDAIRSALSQTYAATEVIVIDDGSTDGSLDVIRGFGSQVRCASGPQGGAPRARNQGLAEARGKWIQFLDADDLLAPTKVARLVEIAESESCDVVFSDGRAVDPVTGQELGDYDDVFDPPDAVLHVLRHRLLVLAPLHRKDMLQAVGGFTEALPCAQERDLHLRLACAGYTFRHVPEKLFTVQRVPGSISSDYAAALKQHLPMFKPAYAGLAGGGRLTDERARAFAEALAKDARHLLREGYPEEALVYFREAHAMHPSGGLLRFGRWYRWAHRTLGPRRAERLASARADWRPRQPSPLGSAPARVAGGWLPADFEEGLVSVVITVYNGMPWFPRALESVAEQTYRPIELVVVDDGSTDGTAGAFEAWSKKPRPGPAFSARLLRCAHRGGCAGLNRGLAETKGEFIQYLDADDLLDSGKIEAHVRALREDPNLEFVYGVAYTFATIPETVGAPRYGRLEHISVADVCRESQWTVNDGLFRRDLVARIGPWNEDLARRRDWEYAVRTILVAGKHQRCPEGISFYRQGHQPVREREYLLRSEQNAIAAYRSMWSHLTAHGPVPRRARDAMARNAFRSAFALAQLDLPSDAVGTATWGLGCRPSIPWRLLLGCFRASLHVVGANVTLGWVRRLVAARNRGADGEQACHTHTR